MSSIPSVPPPLYSQNDVVDRQEGNSGQYIDSEAQLLISPLGNAPNFQKGYLGASDERAAIEGEVQIKGVSIETWENLFVQYVSPEILCIDAFRPEH